MNVQEMIQRGLAIQADPAGPATMSLILEVAEERLRQTKKGYNDDAHPPGVLATAGGAYAMSAAGQRSGSGPMPREIAKELFVDQFFRWDKPTKTAREMLIIAAALIFAEVEKMDRET